MSKQAIADILAEELEKIAKELQKKERAPFARALERLLGFRPTADALQTFANKHPDRWALAVSTLASLAGYEKGVNIHVTHDKPVEQMTDVELLEERRKIDAALGISGRVVDIPVLEVKPEQAPN